VVGLVGKDGGINDLPSGSGDWTLPMSGGGAPSYMGGLLCLKKKNKIRAAVETATTPAATPPAMAPTLEEPPELDKGDEVEETVGVVDAVTVEDGTTEVQVPWSIIAPGGTSGRSEKGSVLIEYD
jgi:hypothetical protein